MAGFNILCRRGGQNEAIKTAVKTPIETPINMAPAVTYKLPKIIGKIPKLAGSSVGDHSVPNKKEKAPILPMAGRPPAKRNTHIKITAKIEKRAAPKKTPSIIFSLYFATRLFNDGLPIAYESGKNFTHL